MIFQIPTMVFFPLRVKFSLDWVSFILFIHLLSEISDFFSRLTMPTVIHIQLISIIDSLQLVNAPWEPSLAHPFDFSLQLSPFVSCQVTDDRQDWLLTVKPKLSNTWMAAASLSYQNCGFFPEGPHNKFCMKLIKERLDNSIPVHSNESHFKYIMHNWFFHLTSEWNIHDF